MATFTQSLWLQTFAAIAVLGAGLVLHLKWHPLRAVFSDAGELLQRLPWLVAASAALSMLALSNTVSSGAQQVTDAWPLLKAEFSAAAIDAAGLPYHLLPAMALAWTAPFILGFLAWRFKKPQARFRNTGPSTSPAFWVFAGLSCVAWAWLALELWAVFSTPPAPVPALTRGLRWLAQSAALAGIQIYLIQIIQGWEKPELPEEDKDLLLALDRSVAQWRNLGLLAGVNFFWLLAASAIADQAPLLRWLLVETALFLATVPLVLALMQPPVQRLAQQAAMGLWRSLPALVGFCITATCVLALTRYAMKALEVTVGEHGLALALARILSALVLATVRCWLFLAFVITLLRYGLFQRPPEKA